MSGADESEGVGRVLRREFKAALARWALHKHRDRRESGSSGSARWAPHDEATHAWDGRRRFAEDYTFCAVQRGLGITVRLEWLPGRGAHRVWMTLLRPDGVWSLPQGQLIVAAHSKNRWSAGGVEIDCVAPLERWTVRYRGYLCARDEPLDAAAPAAAEPARTDKVRVNVDLTFIADELPFSPGADDDPELVAKRLGEAQWDRNLLRAVRRDQNKGYVQMGQMVGTIALGDSLIPARAAALRQHMWGVRDWGAADEAFQCFVAWEDGRRAWVHRARFPFVTFEGGYQRGPEGAREALRSIGASWEARCGRSPANATLVLTPAGGGGATRAEVRTLRDLSFGVDGRGQISLGLCAVDGADGAQGWALWGGQNRTLRRPDPKV